ncbi:hypothetical protein LguiA_029676 [Lonicera macranthoides]
MLSRQNAIHFQWRADFFRRVFAPQKITFADAFNFASPKVCKVLLPSDFCRRSIPARKRVAKDTFNLIAPCVYSRDYHVKWGLEKLVYKDSKTEIRKDHKYAVQPPSVFATEVHMSKNTVGKTTHKTEGRIMYYHYHGAISKR